MERNYHCTACAWFDEVAPRETHFGVGVCPSCGAPVVDMPVLDPTERKDFEDNRDD